mmetsp:Transcript_107739/g.310212  ORF Transcript_107739/g.310212 Transcript_107739/m.310212 type:complete len:426 (+) Transcript_107739:680-1957(+)
MLSQRHQGVGAVHEANIVAPVSGVWHQRALSSMPEVVKAQLRAGKAVAYEDGAAGPRADGPVGDGHAGRGDDLHVHRLRGLQVRAAQLPLQVVQTDLHADFDTSKPQNAVFQELVPPEAEIGKEVRRGRLIDANFGIRVLPTEGARVGRRPVENVRPGLPWRGLQKVDAADEVLELYVAHVRAAELQRREIVKRDVWLLGNVNPRDLCGDNGAENKQPVAKAMILELQGHVVHQRPRARGSIRLHAICSARAPPEKLGSDKHLQGVGRARPIRRIEGPLDRFHHDVLPLRDILLIFVTPEVAPLQLLTPLPEATVGCAPWRREQVETQELHLIIPMLRWQRELRGVGRIASAGPGTVLLKRCLCEHRDCNDGGERCEDQCRCGGPAPPSGRPGCLPWLAGNPANLSINLGRHKRRRQARRRRHPG